MKIRVVPRRWFLERKGTDEERRTFDEMNVISIITPPYPKKNFKDEDVPFSDEYRGLDTVLVLKFHDAEEKSDDDVVLMDRGDADRLYEFVKRTMGNGRGYIVHCTAGKSRSQAVGYVLNEWLNGRHGIMRNDSDYDEYERMHEGVRTMNSLVKRLLMDRFFGNEEERWE